MTEGLVEDELKQWRKKRFRQTEMSLERVVKSITTKKPLVALQQGRVKTRWILNDIKTGEPAVLVHAAVWKWGSDMDTGNFAPGDEVAKGVMDSRLQRVPSYKCELSYVFDTTGDPSLYELSHKLDEFVEKNPKFNKVRDKKCRRVWQRGPTPPESQRFIMTSPLFATRSPYNHTEGKPFRVSYEVHPWIEEALRSNTEWIPDPDKPTLLSYDNGELVDLDDSDPPRFATGDIIWFSFTATFAIGTRSWGPNFRLMELVRVGKIPEPAEPISVDLSMFPPNKPSLQAGSNILIEDDEDDIPFIKLGAGRSMGKTTGESIPAPGANQDSRECVANKNDSGPSDISANIHQTDAAITDDVKDKTADRLQLPGGDKLVETAKAPTVPDGTDTSASSKRKRDTISDGDDTMSSDKDVEGSTIDDNTIVDKGAMDEKHRHKKVITGLLPMKKRTAKGKSKA